MSLAAALLLCAAPLSAATGSAGADFLKIPVSTRGAGMGGALAALSDDLSALELNPARLARIDGALLSGGHMAYFEGTAMDHLAFGYGWSKSGLALSYQSFRSPQIAGADRFGSAAPDFALNDMALALGYGLELGPIGLGLSGRSVTRSLAGLSSSGFGGDLGLSARLGAGFSLALAAQNLGSLSALESVADPLPSACRAGLGWSGQPFGDCGLLVEADGLKQLDSGLQFRGGAEFGYKGAFFIRAGGQWGEAFDGRQSFSAGAGLRLGGIQLDYAYVPFSSLGVAHRASLSLWISRMLHPQSLAKGASLGRPRDLELKPTPGGVDLSWQAPEAGEAMGYAVYARMGADAALRRINPKALARRKLHVKAAFADKEYGFALAAIDAQGREGERGPELKYRPGAAESLAVPEPPKGLKAQRKGKMIFVRWQPSASPGGLSYQVYLSPRQGTAYTEIKHGETDATELQFEPGPLKGGWAFLAVKALRHRDGKTAESEFSEEISVLMR